MKIIEVYAILAKGYAIINDNKLVITLISPLL